jgi:hypothetical protein
MKASDQRQFPRAKHAKFAKKKAFKQISEPWRPLRSSREMSFAQIRIPRAKCLKDAKKLGFF